MFSPVFERQPYPTREDRDKNVVQFFHTPIVKGHEWEWVKNYRNNANDAREKFL